MQSELIFEVILQKAGGFSASCLNAEIAARGETLQELHDNLTNAVDAYFPVACAPDPSAIHLMLFQE